MYEIVPLNIKCIFGVLFVIGVTARQLEVLNINNNANPTIVINTWGFSDATRTGKL